MVPPEAESTGLPKRVPEQEEYGNSADSGQNVQPRGGWGPVLDSAVTKCR